MMDKMEEAKQKNKLTNTDFLDGYQIRICTEILNKEKFNNYIFFGGYEEAERKIIVFYQEKFKFIIEDKKYMNRLCAIRISLPNELYSAYNVSYTHLDVYKRQVHIDGLENLNTFVEFNDDKQFLVVIDTEGGRLSRLSLNDYSSESSGFKLFTYKNNETGNPETTSYGIIMLGEKLSDVVINTKTQGIEISNGKVDSRFIVGMQSIYEDTLNSVTFKVIEEGIEPVSYTHLKVLRYLQNVVINIMKTEKKYQKI